MVGHRFIWCSLSCSLQVSSTALTETWSTEHNACMNEFNNNKLSKNVIVLVYGGIQSLIGLLELETTIYFLIGCPPSHDVYFIQKQCIHCVVLVGPYPLCVVYNPQKKDCWHRKSPLSIFHCCYIWLLIASVSFCLVSIELKRRRRRCEWRLFQILDWAPQLRVNNDHWRHLDQEFDNEAWLHWSVFPESFS